MAFSRCNGINIYYEIVGEGPPLVLINGLGGDTRSWNSVLGYLKPCFTVVVFDLRGGGKTDKPDEPYSITQMADDTLALIETLGFDRVSALGHSMGGCIALDVAVKRSQMLKSLFLVSTFPSWKRPYPMPEDVLSLYRRTDVSPELYGAIYRMVYGPKYREQVSEKVYVSLRMRDPHPQPANAYLNQMRAVENFDFCEEVGSISIPTTIVTGACDRVVNPLNSRWLNEHIADSNLHVFDGVGHHVPAEEPRLLANLLIQGKA